MNKTLKLKTSLLSLQVSFQMAQRTLHKLKEPPHLIPEGNGISSAYPSVWSGTAGSWDFCWVLTYFWDFPCLLRLHTGLEMSLFHFCGIVLLVWCSLKVKAWNSLASCLLSLNPNLKCQFICRSGFPFMLWCYFSLVQVPLQLSEDSKTLNFTKH